MEDLPELITDSDDDVNQQAQASTSSSPSVHPTELPTDFTSPEMSEEECRAQVAPFIEHILTALCSGDEELHNKVLRFLAHGIQRPNKLIGMALVLRGGEEVAKSLIVTTVGSLHGPHFVDLTGSSDGLCALKDDPILVYADESTWESEAALLKALITEPTVCTMRKSYDAESRKNRTHLVLTSSEHWAVQPGRRFVVVDMNSAFSADPHYYAELSELFATTEFRAALFHYLDRHVDLTDYQPRNLPKALWEREEESAHLLFKTARWFSCRPV